MEFKVGDKVRLVNRPRKKGHNAYYFNGGMSEFEKEKRAFVIKKIQSNNIIRLEGLPSYGIYEEWLELVKRSVYL